MYHLHTLCQCPTDSLTLNYKFPLQELHRLKEGVKHRSESYKNWFRDTSEVVEKKEADKRTLEELHSLVELGNTGGFPDKSLQEQLRSITAEADRAAATAQQLLNGKRQTRFRSCGKSQSQNDPTVEELRSFVRSASSGSAS
uniref:Lysine-specific demethylase-like domain-containing protein n=1 Tax=Knipowitschia caucasica TaxID=637954 RepID=A0AAV2M9K2_KNICA